MRWFMVLALMAVASCGADGDPIQPKAGLGIKVGPGGIGIVPTIGVGATAGPVAVKVGF